MNKVETPVSVEQRKLLDLHLSLVIEENKTTNLTRIADWDSAQILHIEDSLAGIPEIVDAPEGRYLDMGTGAGYPGIPVAIMTGRKTLLADSVGKKTKALERIVAELNLKDTVSTFNGRLEELALQQPDTFAVVTARALSNLSSLLELASPLLKTKGVLVCYKTVDALDELEHAQGVSEKLGMRFVSKRDIALSDGTPRVIMTFEKIKESEVKLPRRIGMAQKKPY